MFIIIIKGNIVHGRRFGHDLGFPTANVMPDAGTDLPINGVYAARITIGGKSYCSVLNQGSHPTLPGGGMSIEAFILDFQGDIYGERAEIEYLKFLRPERLFDSPKALAAQISLDVANARAFFIDESCPEQSGL